MPPPIRWGLGLFQVEGIHQIEVRGWLVAHEAPFPLSANGLKEETSLRLGQEIGRAHV